MINSGKKGHTVHMVWCPSHCGITGNDWADELANEGSNMEQEKNNFTADTAKSVIKRTTKRKPHIHHEGLARVYGKEAEYFNLTKDDHLTRQEQTTISRIRCGHHPDFLNWRKKFNLLPPGTESDSCRLCGMDEETTVHVMSDCPAMRNAYPSEWNIHRLCQDGKGSIEVYNKWKQKIERLTNTNQFSPPPNSTSQTTPNISTSHV